VQSLSCQSSNQFKARLIAVPEKSPRRAGRYLIIGITCVIGLLFIHYLTLKVGFFRVKQISVSGNEHYTQKEVIAALDLSSRQSDVHTISRSAIEQRLKQKLSYVKQAHLSKSILKRSLMLEITEREPVALLKYPENSPIRFVLVDLEGYVLEYVESLPASSSIVTIISTEQQVPSVGDRVDSDSVQLALNVLNLALSLAPEIVSTLQTIDTNRSDKITLRFSNLPIVWVSSDFIQTGIYHISLFIKNQTMLVEKGQRTSNPLNGYLDARFKDAIYWGGR
jgi:cell division septal protein FtsQ